MPHRSISRRQVLQAIGVATVGAPLTAFAQGRCMLTFGSPNCVTTPIAPVFAPTLWKTVALDHIAFNVSRATFVKAPERLTAHGVSFYERDRGFMNSIYLKDPNGLTVELACYKFETPEGFRDADVMIQAHRLRVDRGDHHIGEELRIHD